MIGSVLETTERNVVGLSPTFYDARKEVRISSDVDEFIGIEWKSGQVHLWNSWLFLNDMVAESTAEENVKQAVVEDSC
jgi:hypothetical protein